MSASEGKSVIISGRIVWVGGDLFQGQKETIFGTTTPKIGKDGEQSVRYGFGLSVSKADLADPQKAGQLLAAMQAEAHAIYPSGHIPPAFAWKFKDGDTIDDQGKPFALREGYQGCYVFAMTTNIPIRFFRFENGAHLQVADGIKCGDYVNVQVMVKAHAAIGQGKPGLYLNPMMVQLAAPGKEIINAPSAEQVFGNVAPQTPAGYVPPPAPPQMPMMPSPVPQAHYGVVPPALQPLGNGQFPPPPVAPAAVPLPMMPTTAPNPGISAPMPGGHVHSASPFNAFPGIR